MMSSFSEIYTGIFHLWWPIREVLVQHIEGCLEYTIREPCLLVPGPSRTSLALLTRPKSQATWLAKLCQY